jgi:hypothetical protein
MRFVARDRPSDELTLGKMAGLTEISAKGSFEALAIVVVFVPRAREQRTAVASRHHRDTVPAIFDDGGSFS